MARTGAQSGVIRALLGSILFAIAVGAAVLVATFAAELTAIALWLQWQQSDSGGLGATSAPDVAIPLAILAFIGALGWRLIRVRRAAARAR